MKKFYFSLALVAIMTSFTACTNDAEEVFSQENEIKLTSEITPSRVASLDYQSTQIVEGQQIGVTITGAKSEHKNVAWNVGEEGELSNTGDPVYYGDGAATITAYHPFNDDWDENTTYAFSVSTDQSTNAEYLASDLLWATATSSKTESAIPLVFKHKLAKINVTLVSDDIADLSGATISICGTNIATNFNPTDGTLSTATANVSEIKAALTTTSAYTASAIVVPQTVASGTKFIKVEYDNRTFYYTLTANKELKSGYSHNYTLTVKEKKTEIDLGSDNITDWEDEENSGDADEENDNNPVSKTVNNITAGGLASLLTETEQETLTSLKITGKLNSDDIRLIREMAGGQYEIPATPSSNSKLTSLDITDCQIVEGGNAFVSYENTSIYTNENSLGNYTFAYTNLKEVYLPTSVVNLEHSMFMNTNLSKLIIPDNVKEIRGVLFYKNDALTFIDLPANLKSKYLGIVSGCRNLETVTIEDSNELYKVIDGVLYLEEELYYCPAAKTNITIKEGTTGFLYESFQYSKMAEITIPNSVTKIDWATFRYCENLTRIKMESSTPPVAHAFIEEGEVLTAFMEFTNIKNCSLYVPKGSANAYKEALGWKLFTNIVEYE